MDENADSFIFQDALASPRRLYTNDGHGALLLVIVELYLFIGANGLVLKILLVLKVVEILFNFVLKCGVPQDSHPTFPLFDG